MMKKLSLLLIISLMVFAFVPALTLAQDEETSVEEEEIALEEKSEQLSEELEEVLEADYANVEEYLTTLEERELLSTVEKISLEKKLSSYEENLNTNSITSIVDKVLTEEISLGQSFVILNNLEKSTANGYDEEKALEMISSYQNQENSGQLAFQTALELRKLSREVMSEDSSEAFAEEINSIIEEKGEIETSELKQLAAEFRKEAREEEKKKRRLARSKNENSASENALENGKFNKASENASNKSENASNKDNNGKGNSNNSKSKGQGNAKSSNKSSNSKSNNNPNK